MLKKFIISIDQGTTGTRVVLFDQKGRIYKSAYREIKQFFPNPGWVEHDPMEYITTLNQCFLEVMEKGNIKNEQIVAAGIANQRETIVLWDRDTGKPLYNAIVWQCRRSADICEDLKKQGYSEIVSKKTGLLIDAYFSASKIKWLQDNVGGIREKIKNKKVLAGTVDSWIIYNISGGKHHVTDYSNASRTLLLNINDLKWDDELLKIFEIDRDILPDLRPSSGEIAYTDKKSFFGLEIPITGDAGDQQAALFGQACFKPGMAKNTYGTALALMMNIGDKPVISTNGLMTDLAWVIGGKPVYALEGLIFNGGTVIQWLRDGLKIIKSAKEADLCAEKVPDTGNVYIVPAFTGLGAPYWDMYARGLIIGITRGTSREHICRAALESIAYQSKDILDAMQAVSGKKLDALRVDGGATKSDFLMQFQADILKIKVEKPTITEMTALGAAYLAGLGSGFWQSTSQLEKQWQISQVFEPSMQEEKIGVLYTNWQRAVERSFKWA